MKRMLFLLAIVTWILPWDSLSQGTDAEAAKNWSLFFEYHKNGDFVTAAPYGWKVIQLSPTRFKTVYSKLAECYYSFYQSSEDKARKAHVDTMIAIYDLGIKNIPDRSASLYLMRAYALENYVENGGRDLEAIDSYEKALTGDTSTAFAYFDRLGLLYTRHMEENPSFRVKAIDLFRRQKDRDPNNPTAIERLRSLITDPQELIKIAEDDLKNDPQNLEKMWNAAQAYIEGEQYEGAERHLLALIKKSPKTAAYWNELGKVRQRATRFRQAIDAYEEALKLNPALRENYLNITVCYRMMKNFTAARSTVLRAAQKERGWGRPYMELGEVYKAAVEACIKDKKNGDWSKLDIDDKLVYRLAQDAFTKARQEEASLASEANQRYNELSTLVPSREDLFFNKDRIINNRMRIMGSCYSWIEEQVAVSL
ncbi:MAG: tetratricopeptide repeat protein [Ignavibacteriales bacterium]|nr:tetratricopeptide repeat protein [Ignavibacteriales bacterium]